MNHHDLIIRTRKEFDIRRKSISNVFKSHRRLPDQVFHESFGNFLFEEFDWTMSGEFWPVLQKLANQSNDRVILMGILEPDPVDYFYSHFGFFNWCDLPTSLTHDDYVDVLYIAPESSPADALVYNSEVVVWMPLSMKWGVWGERSLEVSILAFHEDELELSHSDFLDSWATNVDKAIAQLLPVDFMKKQIVAEFLKTFRRNYSSINP